MTAIAPILAAGYASLLRVNAAQTAREAQRGPAAAPGEIPVAAPVAPESAGFAGRGQPARGSALDVLA